MNRKKIILVGSSFAGYTAALELASSLPEHEIIVISPQHNFVFIPSLIWYPFGIRSAEDITFDVRDIFNERGINFLEDKVEEFFPHKNEVKTSSMTLEYDYLVIATGPKYDWDYIPGLSPDKNTVSIDSLPHADSAKEKWLKLIDKPGPVIIGAAQEASFFGVAYEFLFNMKHQIRRHKLEEKIKLTFITVEPFLSHLGIGGFGNAEQMTQRSFENQNIDWITNASIKEVTDDGVLLDDNNFHPSNYTMIIPRFLGVDAVRNSGDLSNDRGFILTNEGYQHLKYPNIYSAGVAVNINSSKETAVPCEVPIMGYPSEQMAKIAAKNIISEINGLNQFHKMPFEEISNYSIIDSGNNGMLIVGDKIIGDRDLEFIMPGPQAHWAKLAFEKLFLYKRKRGNI